ncbi:MAG TPA: sugar transferase, partial [Propionibacteriaceae bacterium]|nr:sugar transferase [Propionibacteriaceae bacterium]
MTTIEITSLFAPTRVWDASVHVDAATWARQYRRLVFLTDAIAILVAITATGLVRFGEQFGSAANEHVVVPIAATAVVLGIVWMLILGAVESRNRKVFGSGPEEYRRVINASLYTFGTVAIASYLAHVEVSRFFFLITLPVGTASLLASRWTCRAYLNRVRAQGRALTQTVVVGERSLVAEAVRDLQRHPEAGYQACAVSVVSSLNGVLAGHSNFPVERIPYPELARYLRDGSVGAVVVAGGLTRKATRELSWSLEQSPVELLFLPELADVAGPRVTWRAVEGLGLMQVDLPTYTGWNHAVKRVFDVLFAGVALLLISPLLLAIAVAIKLDDGGPVIFRQQRVGLNGETFMIHKFRTMALDAEARLAALKASSTASNGALFKMEDDPRVTRLGRFLRKSSADELPQFWTVLRGHMSVVGPRPHLANELAEFPHDGLRRLLIKPGITGLWQVNGRSNLSLEESIRLDLSYVENWSLSGDLAIIL